MFTIVTDSYILCGVSQISHADSMSPTETSTLSLTTISTASKHFFFTVYNYRCCSYAFFCCLATTKHHLIEEAISARSAGFSFLKNEKKKTNKLGLEPYSPTTTRMLACWHQSPSLLFFIINGGEGAQPVLCSFPEPFTLSSSILPCASLGMSDSS